MDEADLRSEARPIEGRKVMKPIEVDEVDEADASGLRLKEDIDEADWRSEIEDEDLRRRWHGSGIEDLERLVDGMDLRSQICFSASSPPQISASPPAKFDGSPSSLNWTMLGLVIEAGARSAISDFCDSSDISNSSCRWSQTRSSRKSSSRSEQGGWSEQGTASSWSDIAEVEESIFGKLQKLPH